MSTAYLTAGHESGSALEMPSQRTKWRKCRSVIPEDALKKAGKIQSYRIYNTGAEEPTFEVRTQMGGKQIWGPAPSVSEESLRRDETRRGSKDGAGSRERDSQQHQVLEVEDEMMHGDPEQQDTN